MSFVDGFYSFYFDIINPDAGLYESVRIKTPKHPEETPVHLAARALAYAHSFRPGIEFSEGLYKPDQPAIQVPDGIGGLRLWLDVGCPPPKKVKRAVKEFSKADLQVYFFETGHIDAFCHMLRGTRQNWIAPVEFYLIEPAPLEQLSDNLELRNRWTITFVDTTFYIQTDSIECSGTITGLDIWHAYQNSIGNAGPEVVNS